MTGRLGAGAAASLLVAAVLALACVVLTAGTAQAVPLPVQVSFDNLLPGEVRSTSWPVSVPVSARIAAATVHQGAPGGVQWTAQLCPTTGGGCLDLLSATVGTTVAEGEYRMQVGIDAVNLQPGQSRSFEARYTLAEAEDGWLADTGGSLAMTGVPALALGLVSAALATVGALLVILARRERGGEVPPAAVPRDETT